VAGKFLLAAEQAFTDDDRAERWLKGALVGKSKIQHCLTDDQRNGLDLAIRSAMASGSVNIPEWVRSIDAPDNLKTELTAEIDTRLPDNEFSVTDAFRKKHAKRKWVGDNGLRARLMPPTPARYSRRRRSAAGKSPSGPADGIQSREA
jgi:hypothetical protein